MAVTVSSSSVYVIALVCYAALVTIVVAQQSADNTIRSQCLRELGADITNAGNIVSHMKVMACIFKKEGIMTADGRYSRAKAVEIAHAAFTDRNALTVAIKAAEKCEAQIGPGGKTDEETAAMMVECFAKNGPSKKS